MPPRISPQQSRGGGRGRGGRGGPGGGAPPIVGTLSMGSALPGAQITTVRSIALSPVFGALYLRRHIGRREETGIRKLWKASSCLYE
jgi:hypothetical protein